MSVFTVSTVIIPIVDVHPYIDIYANIWFEPMYHIPLERSRMFHECIIGMLSDDKRTTKALTSRKGSAKNFDEINNKVINALQKISSRCSKKCNWISFESRLLKMKFKFSCTCVSHQAWNNRDARGIGS